MDYIRLSNILLKIAVKMPIIQSPMKYTLVKNIQSALNSAGINETIEWINMSDYQLLKQFEDLMLKYSTKLDVFDKIFTV